MILEELGLDQGGNTKTLVPRPALEPPTLKRKSATAEPLPCYCGFEAEPPLDEIYLGMHGPKLR
jgi:hypothetical protein